MIFHNLNFFFLRILVVATALFSMAAPLNAQTPSKPHPIPTGAFFQGTSFSVYSGKDKLWELHAHHIEGNPKKAKAVEIHGTLYRKGKVRYFLESKVAYINPSTTDIFFPQGAVFESPEEKIMVRRLLWKAREKKFVGSQGVQVRRLNTWLQGDRMILDQNYTEIKLLGHVKAKVGP